MKSARQIAIPTGKLPASKDPGRQDWPQLVDLNPIRNGGVMPAARTAADPPVRPVPGWRLPSGQLLVEYALRAGIASSPLLVRLPLLGGGSEPVMGRSLTALSNGVEKSAAPNRRGTNVAKTRRGGRS